MQRACLLRVTILTALIALAMPSLSAAQYFGRNKVQYRTFEFQILKTDHFDFYYYPEEQDAARIASRMAERWYARLSRFFDHQLRDRQVLILYAAPAHFRQTNAVEGLIGEGTGGVTEALRRRIVLPMSGSLADTDHVIGHELVHAFQFDMTGADPRENEIGGGPGILQYPLWFVEGMAEYLSLGPVDAQTAMWMRDAALHEKLPSIRDLDKPEYFPYRWGHAFWAFVGAKFGDRAVASLVRSAANPRFDLLGLARQLGTDPDTLTSDWHQAILASTRFVEDQRSSLESEAHRVISKLSGGGRYNVGPRVSPDGRRIAFFSERDRFSIELFLADALSGRITRKLVRSTTDPHFDSLQFLNSAGAWSADGKTLALAAARHGHPVLALIDPDSGRVTREVPLRDLDDALNPSFSPDGRSIVLSGNHGGFLDVYLLTLQTGRLEALTHDPFGDSEPVFTPDGQSIVFVTERFSTDLATLDPGPLRLARLTLSTRAITPIAAFLNGKQISPQVSSDGRLLTFIAEPDGVSNIYRMPIDGGPILQVSSFLTGVAGITTASPALSASDAGRLAFSVFENNGHSIYVLDPAAVVATVAAESGRQAAVLPGRSVAAGDVQRMLSDPRRDLPSITFSPPSEPYRRHLKLETLGQPMISGGINSRGGGFIGGSMSASFSDMLGDRLLWADGFIGGTLADMGGQLAYLNRRHRWYWAAVADQMPYRSDGWSVTEDDAANRITLIDKIDRQTVRGGSAVVGYPFSPAARLEFAGGAHAVATTHEIKTRLYTADTERFIEQTVTSGSKESSLYLADSSMALVYDAAYFGATSPILGRRYRVEVSQTTGTLAYTTMLADWRRYFMPTRPVTIAVRGLHIGRYGADAEDDHLVKLYAGYPELLHGYGSNSITLAECAFGVAGADCSAFNRLSGSRMLIGNVEVRAPLVGLFRHDIQYGSVPVEIAAFMDTGVTWSRGTRPSFAGGTRDVLRSVGGAVRVNAFGLAIVELSVARPLDRIDRHWQWQIGLRQGF